MPFLRRNLHRQLPPSAIRHGLRPLRWTFTRTGVGPGVAFGSGRQLPACLTTGPPSGRGVAEGWSTTSCPRASAARAAATDFRGGAGSHHHARRHLVRWQHGVGVGPGGREEEDGTHQDAPSHGGRGDWHWCAEGAQAPNANCYNVLRAEGEQRTGRVGWGRLGRYSRFGRCGR